MSDNPRVFFDFSIKGGEPKRVIFELFQDKVPKTTENFRALCTSEKGFSTRHPDKLLSYKGSIVHRIVPGFMIQGGDFITNNGKSGESIYGGEFEDENFELDCDREGLLVMANKGPNTNQSQWFITLAPAEHLNGKHVVFGRVQSGFNVVQEIAQLETDPKKHRPIGGDRVVEIVHCGQLERKRKLNVTHEDPSKISLQNRSDSPQERKRRSGSRSNSSNNSTASTRSSSTSSESSGAARKRRKLEKKEKKKARKLDKKTKKLKLKDRKKDDDDSHGVNNRRIDQEEVERINKLGTQLETERILKLQQEEENAARLQYERRRKAHALEILKSKHDRNSDGGVIYKGRGAMRYRDNDVTFGSSRAWRD